MTSDYFSDRERGSIPRVCEEIGAATWGGLVALIESRIQDGSLGWGFPNVCPDGQGITGTDSQAIALAVRSEIREISWPLRPDPIPPTLAILDLTQFVFRKIAKPSTRNHHSFYGHDHLWYDREKGQSEFCEDINRILARNGLAFELKSDGQIVRLASPVLREQLASATFTTGDLELDTLLETARKKFLDADLVVRREALEKLWDAWERLKTILPGADKRVSATALLDQASVEPKFRKILNSEAETITTIGNTFQIRHSETSQVSLKDSAHVDYLFHRLFALIWMLLKKNLRA